MVATLTMTTCCAVNMTEIKSDLCDSLVVRGGFLTETEAICLLPSEVLAIRLLPGLFGAGAQTMLLDRLESLEQPVSSRIAEDGTMVSLHRGVFAP